MSDNEEGMGSLFKLGIFIIVAFAIIFAVVSFCSYDFDKAKERREQMANGKMKTAKPQNSVKNGE